MASINERFMDFQIAQQIQWIRLQNRDVQEALRILNRVDGQLELALRQANIGSAPFTMARLEALKAQVGNLLAVVHDDAAKAMTTGMTKATEAAAHVEEQLFKRTLPAGLDVTTPNLGVLQQAASLRPFNGAVMGDWVNELATNDLKRTWNHILDGITSGTTTDDLIRGLIGSKPLQYKDGVREVSRRGMEALVRTSINHATNQGRQMVWEANSDIIKGVRWVSTLDNRTSPICQHRDGRVGPVSTLDGWTPPEGADLLDPPFARPPAHPNCRSTTVSVLKSWKELGFKMDELPAGTRAAMDGQVPASMTYFQWLAKQSDDVQKDVLGPTRWDLWKNHGMQPDKFINDKGRYHTITDLVKPKHALPELPLMVKDISGPARDAFIEIRRWSASYSTPIREGYRRYFKEDTWVAPASIRNAAPVFDEDFGYHAAKTFHEQVFLKYQGNYTGDKAVRVIDFANDDAEFARFASLKPGETFSDVAPSSWAKDASGLTNYYGLKNNVVLRIEGGNLRDVAFDVKDAASVIKEKEILIAPGAKFEVVSNQLIKDFQIGSKEHGFNKADAQVITLRRVTEADNKALDPSPDTFKLANKTGGFGSWQFERAGVGFIDTPLPLWDADLNLYGALGKKRFTLAWDKGFKKVELDPARLTTIQSLLNVVPAVVKDYTKLEPIKVAKLDGHYIVLDGNHRAAALWIQGERRIIANVIDLDDPVNAKLLNRSKLGKVAPPKLPDTPKVRLTEFGTQDGQLGWFEWKKNKTLADMIEVLDPKDFGLDAWPDVDNLTTLAINSGEIVGAIGKVAIAQMRGLGRFDSAVARYELKEILSATAGRSGKFLGQSPKPLAIKDAFDLSDFQAASRSARDLSASKQLRYLDPKEFGLDSWPSTRQFDKMSQATIAGIMTNVRLVITNKVPGGQPKRHMTNLKKKVTKALDETPVPINNAPLTGKMMDRQEFNKAQRQAGNYSVININRLWLRYELDNYVHTVKYKVKAKPLKVTLGKKNAEGIAGERINANFRKVERVMPAWVLHEIENVSQVEMTVSERAFYSPWEGKALLSQQNPAEVYVHEFFHALDFKYRFGHTDVKKRSNHYMRDSLDWRTDDPILNRLAALTREEFIRRDSKGKGRFSNDDGEYWLGDWERNYEGRFYPDLDKDVSSEYITMATQRYASALMRGQSAFDAERARMRMKQPAMLELLDYIWSRS